VVTRSGWRNRSEEDSTVRPLSERAGFDKFKAPGPPRGCGLNITPIFSTPKAGLLIPEG